MGPHQMFGNIPRSIEFAVGWVSELIAWAVDNNVICIEATEEGKNAWTKHVHECAVGLLANEVDSWMTGVNKNVKGKRCDDVRDRGYEDFRLVRG
jgi:hypothetical protein